MELEVQYACRTELVAMGASVVVRILEGHTTTCEDIDRLTACFEAELGDAPLVAYVQIIGQGTPALHPDVRRHAAALLDRYGDKVVTVMVMEGLGFWSMTLRLALRTFARMVRKTSIHIEDGVEKAAEVLARELVGINPEDFLDAYAELLVHMRSL